MKGKLILAFLVLLGLSLAPISCNRHAEEKAELQSKLEQLQTTLKQTQAERDTLKANVTSLSKSLGEAKSELASVKQARDDLQLQSDKLADARGALQHVPTDHPRVERRPARNHHDLVEGSELVPREPRLVKDHRAAPEVDPVADRLAQGPRLLEDLL